MTYQRKEVIGDITMYLGDCRDVLPLIGKVDAIVCDPPYEGISTKGGGAFGNKNRPYQSAIRDNGLDAVFDESLLSPDICDSFVCFSHNDKLCDMLVHAKANFDRHAILSWHKSNPMPVANKHYRPDTEFFVHAWKMGHNPPKAPLQELGRYWIGPVGKSEWAHPTVKPLPLMEKIIKNTAGDLICDPFMGTGTTLEACARQGRSCIGIEHNPKFFEMAVERIRNAGKQSQLF